MAKRKAKPKEKPVRPPRGQVGPKTFEQVRKVVDEKNVTLLKAFDEVAKATGRKASTVAVTYYRIARQKGGGRNVSAGRGVNTGSPRKLAPAIQIALSRASSAIKELETVISGQAQEIAQLRNESRLADRIRKAFQE